MNASLHYFTGCFDCTSLVLPIMRKKRVRKQSNTKSEKKRSRKSTRMGNKGNETTSFMALHLGERVAESTSSIATATTANSTRSAESPVSFMSCDTSHCRNCQRESPATVCFLPHEIKQVNFKSLQMLDKAPPPPAESFYFLPLHESEFADLQEITDKNNWGYYIDFD